MPSRQQARPAGVDVAIDPVIPASGVQYALVLSLNGGYVQWKDTSDGSYPRGHEVTTFASMYSNDTASGRRTPFGHTWPRGIRLSAPMPQDRRVSSAGVDNRRAEINHLVPGVRVPPEL